MTEQKKETECWQWGGDPSGSDGFLMSEEAQRELLAETLTIIARNNLKRREAEMWSDFWREVFFRTIGAVIGMTILFWMLAENGYFASP